MIRSLIFAGGMGVLVAACGYSALHHWQAWVLLLGAVTLRFVTEKPE